MSSHVLTRMALVALCASLALNLGSGCPSAGPTVVSGGESDSAPTGGTPGSGGSGEVPESSSGGETAGPAGPSGGIAASGTVSLAATGQTTSYADDDDGDHQAGEAVDSATRFVDNGDGTITDSLTGLMWLRDASCMIQSYPEWETDGWADGWVPWADAFDFIAQVNAGILSACGAGNTDWRVPNVNELESLVNAGAAEPNEWLMNQGFENVEANSYWTSTTDPATTSTFGYVVDFDGGGVSRLGNKGSVINSVWPVRDTTDGSTTEIWKTGQTTRYTAGDDGDLEMGTAWPEPRFADNGDGTISDNLTGLTWLQDASCLGGGSWQEALIIADRFNSNIGAFGCGDYTASHTDWRLPNRKELYSLADFSQHDPALQAGHPFIDVNINSTYWTSTTYAGNTERAWHGDLRTGELGTDYKANGHYVILVR